MATDKELLVARIFLRAVLPVIKVMIEDDPKFSKRFRGVTAAVQFVAKDDAGPVGAYLRFTDGAFEAVLGIAGNPDITFKFSSVAKMNAMFAGKPVLPSIKGFTKIGLLIKVFSVLLGLKILMPDWRYPDAPLHALYHRNRFVAPRVRVVLDFLTARFAQVADELDALVPCAPVSAPEGGRRKRL